jgi:DNA-binding IclR family transcriptional regulator
MSVKEPSSRRIQSVDRAVSLLRAVAESPRPASLADLADKVGLNRSTAWRLLLTLEHHGLVDRDAAQGGFVIGYEVGRLALRSGGAGLVRRVRPALTALAEETGMAAVLSVPTATEPLALDQVDPPGLPEPNMVGWGYPVHASAAGKVWLAFLDESEREELLRRPLARFTPSTLVDARALRRELDEVRRTSIAVDRDEWDPGWTAIATPILDDGAVVAMISVMATTPRFTDAKLRTTHRQIRAAAATAAATLR